CAHNGTPASHTAVKIGSQYPFLSCNDGNPSGCGFSENATARAPLATHRSISRAARAGSHNGMITNGMNRPGTDPHHSSTIQSLYAWMHANPSSRSRIAEKHAPATRGKFDGKRIDASTPSWSMSCTRATGSYAPRGNSSYVTGSTVHSCGGLLTTPSNPWMGCIL